MLPTTRIFVATVTILFLLTAVRAQTPPRETRPRTASLSGRVTINGQPVANAMVMAIEMKQAPLGENPLFSMAEEFQIMGQPTHKARTDTNGRYQVSGLAAGNYRVNALSKAYVAEASSPGVGGVRTITLDEHEARADVDFKFVRGGVITGRVTDAAGRPAIARQIHLEKVSDDAPGRDIYLHSPLLQPETDDRGIYRAYGLEAGRYRVSAGVALSILGAAPNQHSRTYHPDVTDAQQAKLVEVKEGAEVSNIDIRLGGAKRTYEAVGRVVDDETGQPLPKVNLMCIATGQEQGDFGGWGGNAMTDAQGNFRFAGLVARGYQLSLAPAAAEFLSGGSEYYGEAITFEIADSNVGNLEIRAKRGASISGVVALEGTADKTKLAQAMITAQASDEPSSSAGPFFSGFLPTKIEADGSFRLRGLSPGQVAFQVLNLSGKMFPVRRIELNGVEMPAGIHIKPGEKIAGVRVVLNHGSGVIRGQVKVTGGKLPDGTRLMITAHHGDAAGAGAGFAPVDDKYRFLIEDLMPGQYELMLMVLPGGAAPTRGIEPVTQRVTVNNGVETPVTLTINVSEKKQEERQ